MHAIDRVGEGDEVVLNLRITAAGVRMNRRPTALGWARVCTTNTRRVYRRLGKALEHSREESFPVKLPPSLA